MPAHDEEGCLPKTISDIVETLHVENVPFELVIVNDHSKDDTQKVADGLAEKYSEVRVIENLYPNGFGFAIRMGLDVYKGDAVAVVMADGSDAPEDIVKYYHILDEGYDCAFGSRFIKKGSVIDYPVHKLILNRMANFFIKVIFRLNSNDITNAFKAYRRQVIDGVRPILSNHFNLTVELPLKAIIRGFSYKITPISWRNRATGVSKLKIKEMGSRYLFIVLYAFIEKHLSRGDYVRKPDVR